MRIEKLKTGNGGFIRKLITREGYRVFNKNNPNFGIDDFVYMGANETKKDYYEVLIKYVETEVEEE